MSAIFIKAKNDNSPVTLSVSIGYGHKGTTVIMINHVVFATMQDDFQDLVLGANNSLDNNTIVITTSVLKTSPAPNSIVTYDLKGAQQPDNHVSNKQFSGNNPIAAHYLSYYFI